jgi:RNA polymerase sigma factor (sigma-70 family)
MVTGLRLGIGRGGLATCPAGCFVVGDGRLPLGGLAALSLTASPPASVGHFRSFRRRRSGQLDNLHLKLRNTEACDDIYGRTQVDGSRVTESREARFRALFDADRSHLLAYALRRTSSPEDAADVVAEAFLIAWEHLDAVPSGKAGRLWLYATARNVVANHWRRLQRRSRLIDQIAGELRGSLQLSEPPGETRLEAIQVLSKLPEEDREVLMLAGWEGLNSKELGMALRCSPVAARIRLHRARTRMASVASLPRSQTKQRAPFKHVEGEPATEGPGS